MAHFGASAWLRIRVIEISPHSRLCLDNVMAASLTCKMVPLDDWIKARLPIQIKTLLCHP
jgi:hypothetical protein